MSEPHKYSYLFGHFRLSLVGNRLFSGEHFVTLSDTQFKTLLKLVEQPGELLGKNVLRDYVFGNSTADPNNIEQAVHDLRQILHDPVEKSELIKTVRGKGYRFMAEVRRVEDETSEPQVTTRAVTEDSVPGKEFTAPPAGEESLSAQPAAEVAATAGPEDGMDTFDSWLSGPGKGVTGLLSVCVLLTCLISLVLSQTDVSKDKPFATAAQFVVVLLLYAHFRLMGVPVEVRAIKEEEEEEFRRSTGSVDIGLAVKALRQYRRYWRGLLLSWLSLYLCLTFIAYAGYDLSRLAEETDPHRQNVGVTLSIANTLCNNWNTLMIFLCFWVLNKQIQSEEEVPNILDRLLSGPFLLSSLLVAVTAFEVSLILPIDKTAIPRIAALVSGIGGGVAMALYVGRLQSKFIGPRLWLLIALYSYTAIQPLFLYLDEDTRKTVLLIDVALILKCLLYLYMAWLLQSGRLLFYLVRVRSAYLRVNTEWRIFRRFLKKG